MADPMDEKPLRPPPSFLAQAKDRPAPPARDIPRDTPIPRDTRDIRELAQRIDGLMYELIDRLENLNVWLGQVPRVK